jgi:exodeoxyribonuclease VII small subunit
MNSPKNPSFEKNMLRLEEILEKMNGQVSLDEAIDFFEEADKLVKQCQKKLDEAQNRIEKILVSRNLEDKPEVEPFKISDEV